MPPKKKASEAAAPSATNPPSPEKMAGGEDAGGRTGVDEGAHGATRSKDKVALPVGGIAGSHDDRASVDAPRPSQEARDRQRHGTHGTIRLLNPNRAGISGCSRPACTPTCWRERGTVAWTEYCSF